MIYYEHQLQVFKRMDLKPSDSLDCATMEVALKDALEILNHAHKKLDLDKSTELKTEFVSILCKVQELIARFSVSPVEEPREFKIPVLDENKRKSKKRSRQEEFVEFLKNTQF